MTQVKKTTVQERGCQVLEWKPSGRGSEHKWGGRALSPQAPGTADGEGTDGDRLSSGRKARAFLLTASNFSMKTFHGRCWVEREWKSLPAVEEFCKGKRVK